MSLKNKLVSYTPLELKEFIKEHNKRARKMVSEETKEFRKEQLSKLIIKAVGKKDDLIKKMVDIANIKDISSFKLIKEKGKMSQQKKNELDEVQTKEAEQLAKDFKKGKIDEKEIKKKLDEIKKERIRAELPKLNVSKLLKFIKEKPEPKKAQPKQTEKKTEKKEQAKQTEKKEDKKKDKPPQPKRKAPTLAEVRAKNLKEKREAMKPKRKPPMKKEPIKPKGKAPAPPKKEQEKKEEPKEESESEDDEFEMPKFFKNTDPKIRENIEKAVKKGELPESSIILVTTYKTLKKIKTAVEKKDKDNEDRIDGLGRGLNSDSQDEEYYKAIFGKKYPKKEIEKDFLSVAKNMIGGQKATRDKVRKWIDKADVAIQKKLFNSNKEGYLLSVTGINDKTGESRKQADKLDQALAKQKADREKDFAKAKAEQDKELDQVKKERAKIESKTSKKK